MQIVTLITGAKASNITKEPPGIVLPARIRMPIQTSGGPALLEMSQEGAKQMMATLQEHLGQTSPWIIRKILGIQAIPPADAKQPTILHVECETESGPLVVRLSQIAGVELAAALNKHPLTRGSL